MLAERAVLLRHTDGLERVVRVLPLGDMPGILHVRLAERARIEPRRRTFQRHCSTRRGLGVPLHICKGAATDVCELCKRDTKNGVAGTTGWVNLGVAFERGVEVHRVRSVAM